VKEIESSNTISRDLANLITSKLNGAPKELLARLLNDSSNKPYPKELKEFSLTLHFYSPKGYNYVRDTFNLNLPCERTIRSWYKDIDGEPGFTQDSFCALKQHVEDAKKEGKELFCALMMDEMAIKKHVQFFGKDYTGLVDLGDGGENEDAIAKDAYVLMAVDINGNWKLPLGYFLIDSLTAKDRAKIISECLTRLNEIGA
jgi:hypothetical protein